MTLQNRVNPWGELETVSARGTMTGNRGGKFHKDDQTLGRRRWANRRWIACELHYRGWHHAPMGRGYTSVFFLDEVTALAAGHRPCFLCRRAEATRFVTLSGLSTDALDRRLHDERTAPDKPVVSLTGLPDGAMVELGGKSFALRGDLLLRWTHWGYDGAQPREAGRIARLLTPPTILAILRGGYQPRWHESALMRDAT